MKINSTKSITAVIKPIIYNSQCYDHAIRDIMIKLGISQDTAKKFFVEFTENKKGEKNV